MLPDRQTLLFRLTTDAEFSPERCDTARIVAQSLETGKRETILEPGADARFVPTGYILYALGRNGVLPDRWIQPRCGSRVVRSPSSMGCSS